MERLDMTVILSTLITALASIAGAFLAVKKGNHQKELQDIQREQRQNDKMEHIEDRIDRLEKKVDTHNGYAEKFAKNSESLAVLATKIESIEKRI